MFDVIDTLFDELYKGLNDKINKNESIKDYFLTMNDNEIKKLSNVINLRDNFIEESNKLSLLICI